MIGDRIYPAVNRGVLRGMYVILSLAAAAQFSTASSWSPTCSTTPTWRPRAATPARISSNDAPHSKTSPT